MLNRHRIWAATAIGGVSIAARARMSTDKQSPMAWAVGQSPAHAARSRSSTSGLLVPNSANHFATVRAIESPGTQSVRPPCRRSVNS